MRDDHYSQRLNQIREKYGYYNDRNPEENTRQHSYRRQIQPAIPPHSHTTNYLKYEINQKPTFNHTWQHSQPSGRYQKENCPIPPLSVIKNPPTQLHRQRQSFLQEDSQRFNMERPRSQRPSFSECGQYSDLCKGHCNAHNDSSPIRKYQCELSTQNTPRQYTNNTQRSSTGTPLRNNKTQNHLKEEISVVKRSPIPKAPADETYEAPRRVPVAADRNERVITFRKEEPVYNKNQGQYSKIDVKEEQTSKSNYDLHKIDKIQQRIQQALNKNKK